MQHVLNLSENFDVYADANQWILTKARNNDAEARTVLGYVGGTKTTLLRLCRKKSVVVWTISMDAINEWPERFLDWKKGLSDDVAKRH